MSLSPIPALEIEVYSELKLDVGSGKSFVGNFYKSFKWRSMALRRLNAGPALQAIERGEL